MPRLVGTVPKYRKHRASGQAVVTLSGVDFYLGPYRTKISLLEYDRVVGEWLAAGRELPAKDCSSLTVVELVARYWKHARQYYSKNGRPTGEISNLLYALRPLKERYGHTQASDFGPLALKALREQLIQDGLSRKLINSRIGKIRGVFRWGVSEQLVPEGVITALESVQGLKEGRSAARETKPVEPVNAADFEATLVHLPQVVADMARLQRLCGCRPGEVCALKPCDVDTSSDVWCYMPESHKTEHHGRKRRIYIGPRGQDVLRKYLLRSADSYCFSPAESERKRKQAMREHRKSKVQPSQADRRKHRPKWKPSDRYEKDDYARAVRRACDKAGVARWSPNQLRHAAASEIREKWGLEAAQTVLGHSKANTTELYAERDFAKAASIMRDVG